MSENNLGEAPAIAETELPIAVETVEESVAEPAPAKVEQPEDKLQKRFDKLTREKYEAQRRADRLEWELEQTKSQAAKPPQVAPEQPTLESSGFDEGKYQQALIEYSKATAKAEVERILKEREQQQQVTAKQTEFEKRQAEFIKSKPDYAEKVLENDDLHISHQMASVIRRSDMGPQVAYYLAEHADTAVALAQLQDPVDVAREIGRIEARLEAQKVAPAVVSKAPPPAAKIDATEPAIEKDPSQMSDAEFAKWRKRQIAQRNR